MENMPKVGVGVIVINNGKILLGKRKNSHSAGVWAFPGGHLEFKETPEDCVIREVYEETGIKVKNIKSQGYTNDIFENDNKHYITLFMSCEYDSGELQNMEPEKCEGWDWFDWFSLPQPLMIGIPKIFAQNFNPFK